MKTASRSTGDSSKGAYLWHVAIRGLLHLYLILIGVVSKVGGKKRDLPDRPLDILITGTFHSLNWIEAHLRPLASSHRVRSVRMVASSPVPAINKVEPIYPPKWMLGLLGGVAARLVQFVWTALTTESDVIGGFHLLFNGMAAAALARLKGATSLYICGGGVQEVIDGGILSENRLFQKLQYGDKKIEAQLVRAASHCDILIAMGESGVSGLSQLGVRSKFFVISGGRDPEVFRGSSVAEKPEFDVVFVGRLAAIKRVDLLLRSIALVKVSCPTVRAVIVGDGPLRPELESLAAELDLSSNVQFVGLQQETHTWFSRSKVFVLTSESEGLSLALIEAMMSGLPAVVPDVGDLSSLTEDAVSGFVVRGRSPEDFAGPLATLLTNQELCRTMSTAAKRLSRRFEVSEAAMLWDRALGQKASTTEAVLAGVESFHLGGGN